MRKSSRRGGTGVGEGGRTRGEGEMRGRNRRGGGTGGEGGRTGGRGGRGGKNENIILYECIQTH
jgi:hypothetical protein